MSSRIIRPSDGNASRASVWRPHEHAGAPLQWGTESFSSASLSREFEARAKAAYQQGFAAGQASGIQQASEPVQSSAAAMNRLVAELASVRKRFRADVEEDTVKLAIAIARRVLHRELATDPEAILGLVIAAFQKLNARETHRLRLSPPDAAIVQEHRSRFEFPQAMEIVADPSLAPATVIFETSRGELDASVDTQLAEIERGFTDLVKRRSR